MPSHSQTKILFVIPKRGNIARFASGADLVSSSEGGLNQESGGYGIPPRQEEGPEVLRRINLCIYEGRP